MAKPHDKVLLDADALVAAANVEDSNHHTATIFLSYIETHRYKKYMSNLVIYEIANVLSIRASQKLAVQFLDSIFTSDIEIIYIDEAHTHAAVQKFKTYAKKNVSFVDCCNLTLIEEYQIEKIFSFDKFYKDKLFKI